MAGGACRRSAAVIGRRAGSPLPAGVGACEVAATARPEPAPRVARRSAPVSEVCGKMAPRAPSPARHNSVIVCLAITGVSGARARSPRRGAAA